jgi:hypothetical protein
VADLLDVPPLEISSYTDPPRGHCRCSGRNIVVPRDWLLEECFRVDLPRSRRVPLLR